MAMNQISFLSVSVTHSRLKSLVGVSDWPRQVICLHSDAKGMGEEMCLSIPASLVGGEDLPSNGGFPTRTIWIQMLESQNVATVHCSPVRTNLPFR